MPQVDIQKIYSQGIYVWYIVEVHIRRWINKLSFTFIRKKIKGRFWLKDILIPFWHILYLVSKGCNY